MHEGSENFVGVGHLGDFGAEVGRYLAFQAGTGFCDKFDDVIAHALGLIDEPVVKGNAAKNAVESDLVFGRERGIELCGVKVVHGFKIEREVDASVEGTLMLYEGFHNLNVGTAQHNAQTRAFPVSVD